MSVTVGCSTATKTVKYSHDEIAVIPPPLLPRILTTPAANITVEITAATLDGYATVTTVTPPNRVVVSQGDHDTALSFDAITTIVQTQRLPDADGTGTAGVGEQVGTALIHAPLIPVAAATWPFMRLAGMDMNQNSSDSAKAMAIFGGLSRQAVGEYLGPPEARHLCSSKGSADALAFEVWSYPKERVIRGARALFFDVDDGTVFHAAVRFPTWANCNPLDTATN